MTENQDDGTPTPADDTPTQTIYETSVMSPAEIEKQNKAYAAMNLPILVIDVSQFTAKHERQADGTYKRSAIRQKRRNNGSEAGANQE